MVIDFNFLYSDEGKIEISRLYDRLFNNGEPPMLQEEALELFEKYKIYMLILTTPKKKD